MSIQNIISKLVDFYNNKRGVAIGILLTAFLLFVVLFLTLLLVFKRPPAPTDIRTVTSDYNKIRITWIDKDKKSSGYNIYRSEDLLGDYLKISSTYNRNYTDTDLEPGKTYYYRITKIKGNKESDYSVASHTTTEEVGTVSNLRTEEVGNNYIKIAWDGFKGSEGFIIYRSEDVNNPYTRIGTTKEFFYTDENLETKKIYYYAVTQIVEKEESDFSSQLTAATKDWQCGDAIVYDQRIYNTVKIGEQCWFKENLKYETEEGSFCYEDITTNCEKDGRLYTFETATKGDSTEKTQGLCPLGWHVPSDEDFKVLERNIGMKRLNSNDSGWRGEVENIGNRLKAVVACTEKGGLFCGTSGFNLTMGGNRGISGVFRYIGMSSSLWTSTSVEEGLVWTRFFSFDNAGVNRKTEEKEKGHFLRCIKD